MEKPTELWDGFESSARFNVESFMLSVKEAREPAPLVALVNMVQSLMNLMVVQLAREGVVLPEQAHRLSGSNIALSTVVEMVKMSLSNDQTKEQTEEEKVALQKTQDKFLSHLLMGNQ